MIIARLALVIVQTELSDTFPSSLYVYNITVDAYDTFSPPKKGGGEMKNHSASNVVILLNERLGTEWRTAINAWQWGSGVICVEK